MKIALIGDIHSRFAQAEQVVTQIRKDHAEAEIICMGDVFEVEKKAYIQRMKVQWSRNNYPTML